MSIREEDCAEHAVQAATAAVSKTNLQTFADLVPRQLSALQHIQHCCKICWAVQSEPVKVVTSAIACKIHHSSAVSTTSGKNCLCLQLRQVTHTTLRAKDEATAASATLFFTSSCCSTHICLQMLMRGSTTCRRAAWSWLDAAGGEGLARGGAAGAGLTSGAAAGGANCAGF